jgi:hypothetical protein
MNTVCEHGGLQRKCEICEARADMATAHDLLAAALLPRENGVYWCARAEDQAKIDEAMALLSANSVNHTTEAS